MFRVTSCDNAIGLVDILEAWKDEGLVSSSARVDTLYGKGMSVDVCIPKKKEKRFFKRMGLQSPSENPELDYNAKPGSFCSQYGIEGMMVSLINGLPSPRYFKVHPLCDIGEEVRQRVLESLPSATANPGDVCRLGF